MTKFNRLKTYAYLEKCYGKFQVPISKIQVDNVTSLLREKTSPTVYKFFKDHKKLGLLKALTINQHNSLAVLHQIEFRKFIYQLQEEHKFKQFIEDRRSDEIKKIKNK